MMMPLPSTATLVSEPGAKPSCVRLVTPKLSPRCVAPLRSSVMFSGVTMVAPAGVTIVPLSEIGSAETALIGPLPSARKSIGAVVMGSGAPGTPFTGWPFAVAKMFHWSLPAFWK